LGESDIEKIYKTIKHIIIRGVGGFKVMGINAKDLGMVFVNYWVNKCVINQLIFKKMRICHEFLN
jgi:hypothetical protein